MEKAELVFIPFPVTGHLIPTIELAKLLLNHDHRISITVLIIKLPNYDPNIETYTNSIEASSSLRNLIRFVFLPEDNSDIFSFSSSLHRHIPHVKQAVSEITRSGSDSPRLAGFVLDMFCTAMIDVANDFGVPSYIFFTSGAAYLGFNLHMQVIFDEQKADPAELVDSEAELLIPSLLNPFPAKAMPQALLSKQWFPILLQNHRRFKEAKGFIINTFFELESHAVECFSNGKFEKTISVYPIGPILNVGCDKGSNKQDEIIQWLDDQPTSSVVFLCFGSKGSFGERQVKEIAYALERSGHRFLWSLRRPPPTGTIGPPTDYENLEEVLPDGFLDRTVKMGKIIGWAPQMAILAHEAVGGFVSHCGWNSVLESIWYGVPIAAWPMYAEQQFNAFEMVVELGLAVEIQMDYRPDSGIIVSRDKIEDGIKLVMEQDSEKRNRVKKMSEKSRTIYKHGESSYKSIHSLIKNVII